MFVREAFAQAEAPIAGTSPTVDEGPVPPTAEVLHVEEPTGGFPPLETEFFASQLLWLAITFGLLYWMMSKFLAPRLAGIIENRHDRIAFDIDAADRMRLDADEAQAAYEQELATARDRSHLIGQDAREKARADAEIERKRTEGDLERQLEEAQARIGEIKTRALADVDAIAVETTETILEALAGVSASREDVASAVRSATASQEPRNA